MYGTGMLYELGKQRMQEFMRDSEGRRMLNSQSSKSSGLEMREIELNLAKGPGCC